MIILAFPKFRFNHWEQRSVILHKNNSIFTITLLKSWNDVTAQKALIALTKEGTDKRIESTHLLEKVWPYNKWWYKPLPHNDHCRMKWYWSIWDWIFFWPYSAILCIDISFQMEISFVCPHNFLRPFLSIFIWTRNSKAKVSLAARSRESNLCTWVVLYG